MTEARRADDGLLGALLGPAQGEGQPEGQERANADPGTMGSRGTMFGLPIYKTPPIPPTTKGGIASPTSPTSPHLDSVTLREVLGDQPDPHDMAIIKFDVMEALAKLEAGIRAGQVPARQLIRGRPLADWLSLDDVARLLRAGR